MRTIRRSAALVLALTLWWLASHSGALARAPACQNWSRVSDTIGLYFANRGVFFLHDSDHSEFIQEIAFGGASGRTIGIVGDWDRSGFDSVGVYDPDSATFRLKPGSSARQEETRFVFGNPGQGNRPVAGDWTGKGYASVGVYDRQSRVFRLRHANAAGAADLVLPFGIAGEGGLPIAGDWVGDGITRVGLYDEATGTFHLRLTNDPGNTAARSFRYGAGEGMKPLFGRWQPGSAGLGVAIWRGNAVLQKDVIGGGRADRTLHMAPQGTPHGLPPQLIAGRWRPDRCLLPGQNTTPDTPAWARGLVMYEMRLSTFTEDSGLSRLAAATRKLDELQDLGITAIILTPVHDGPTAPDLRESNLYAAGQPDKLNPRLGTDAEFKAFVSEAHARGIRVLVDVVLHGLFPASPYVTPGPRALPPDWFSRTADGAFIRNHWGMVQFNWSSPGLREWWTENVGVAWIKRYDIDGYRMDLEPATAGSPLWTKVRDRVREATGKPILLVPELQRSGRAYLYDMSQNDFLVSDFLEGRRHVVETVRGSPEIFYTSGLSNHDSKAYYAHGRLAAFAYGLVLSPFVPRWFAGEEFNASPDFIGRDHVLYFSQIHWEQKARSVALVQQVRRLIEIRRRCQDIVAPLDRPLHRANIVAAASFSGTDLEPYSMWDGDTSITVLAKAAAPSGPVTVVIPVDRMGMRQPYFQVTDMLAGTNAVRTRAEVLRGLTVSLPQGGAVVLKLEARGTPDGDGARSGRHDRCS